MHGCRQPSEIAAIVASPPRYWTLVVVLYASVFVGAATAQQDDEGMLFPDPADENVVSDDQSTEGGETQDTSTFVLDEQDPNMQLGVVFQRLNEVQRENSHLLGRVEQLEHELQVLRKENRERYAGLDERLLQLSGQPTVSPSVVPTGSTDTEEGMYVTAFAHIEDHNFEEAITFLESMIETYPNGKRLPEAFYWLGETYARLDPPQFEKARQSLVQLVRLYPDHAKAAEGTYKLGTIYEQLGDEPKALEYLDRAANNYPNTTAARLAADYAQAIRNPDE